MEANFRKYEKQPVQAFFMVRFLQSKSMKVFRVFSTKEGLDAASPHPRSKAPLNQFREKVYFFYLSYKCQLKLCLFVFFYH